MLDPGHALRGFWWTQAATGLADSWCRGANRILLRSRAKLARPYILPLEHLESIDLSFDLALLPEGMRMPHALPLDRAARFSHPETSLLRFSRSMMVKSLANWIVSAISGLVYENRERRPRARP